MHARQAFPTAVNVVNVVSDNGIPSHLCRDYVVTLAPPSSPCIISVGAQPFATCALEQDEALTSTMPVETEAKPKEVPRSKHRKSTCAGCRRRKVGFQATCLSDKKLNEIKSPNAMVVNRGAPHVSHTKMNAITINRRRWPMSGLSRKKLQS